MDAALHDSARTCGVFVTFCGVWRALPEALPEPLKGWGYLPASLSATRLNRQFSHETCTHCANPPLVSGVHSGFRSRASV